MIQSQPFSIISPETTIDGTIKFSGILRHHGIVHGDFIGNKDSHLIIEETGMITGNITADTVTVLGTFQGKVIARKTIEILSTGKILGEVQSPALEIHPAAIFDANVSMSALIEKPLQLNPLV